MKVSHASTIRSLPALQSRPSSRSRTAHASFVTLRSLAAAIGLVLLPLTALSLTALPAAAQDQQPAQPPVRIRATIDAVDAQTLTVTTRDGKKEQITLLSKYQVIAVSRASLSDIKPGSFIGTAAVQQKGKTLRALEIHIFDESMRGSGEGHRPWDVAGAVAKPNESPKQVSLNSMTNGTVSQMSGAVTGNDARHITVTYKGGQQQVMIPSNAPIVALAPGDPSLLMPGVHIIALATKAADGSLQADRVLAGKDSVVPPM
ncbi:MAG: hypothetical protein ABWY00_00860 [Dongiaceae bacterium]